MKMQLAVISNRHDRVAVTWLYEIAGTCHMSVHPAGPAALPVIEERRDFPMDMLAGAALLNLRRWVVDGVAPRVASASSCCPIARRGVAAVATSRPLLRDEHGNAVRGVRSPWVDVPVARYYPHSTPRTQDGASAPGPNSRGPSPADVADLMGCMVRFTPDKLRSLYGSPARYRARFAGRLERAIEERWIAAADRERALAMAARIEF